MKLEETLKALQDLDLLSFDVLIPIRAEIYSSGEVALEVDSKNYNSTMHIKLRIKETPP